MSSLHACILTVIGFSALSTGCLAAGDDADDMGSPVDVSVPKTPQDGQGNPTGNGEEADFYLAEQGVLDGLMQIPLSYLMSHTLRSDFNSFVSSEPGAKLFRYAVGCALGANDYVTQPGRGGATFHGAGIMTTAQSWHTSGLNQEKRNAVHACIVTRLNPSGTSVPIMLSGPEVNGIEDFGEYSRVEGVWLTRWNNTTHIYQTAFWPGPGFATSCDVSFEAALQTRTCGTEAGQTACHVTFRSDFATQCIQSFNYNVSPPTPISGSYLCRFDNTMDYMPAIQTQLPDVDSLLVLYPGCEF